MNRKMQEQLLDTIGNVDECYITEYIDAQTKKSSHGQAKIRLSIVLAAAMVMLFGTVCFAAAPAIGHFLANLTNEQQAVIQNFDKIQEQYALSIGDTQECDGVIGTLNSATLEDHFLLLSYTFDWSGLEEAKDGSFHTYFLPWFFYITEGDTTICESEYTKGLHTEPYLGDEDEDAMKGTYLYSIDLEGIEGSSLVGKELTVRLLYSQDSEGFVSTFTPTSCFTDKTWNIGKTYEFGEHSITLDKVSESALYVTLFIDCGTIGHVEDAYAFVLSDESGNDYTVYPYDDNDTEGYWFIKPEKMGMQLTLKVIRSRNESNSYGQIPDDSYEVLYEIPIELMDSF